MTTQSPPEALSGQALADFVIAEFAKQADKRDNDLLGKMVAKLQEEITAKFAELEAKRAALPVVKGLDQSAINKFNFGKLCYAALTRDHSAAGYEIDLCKEAAKTVGKDMSTLTDAAGGFIVPNQIMADRIVPLLSKKVVAYKLGAQSLPCNGNPVQIPKITGAPTAYWVGENQSTTSSDMTFGRIDMTPKACAAHMVMSNRLLRDSSPAADQIFTDHMVRYIGLEVDRAYFVGTGASNEPWGLVNTTGINTISFGSLAANAAYGKLIDMEAELSNDNVDLSSVKWAMHSSVKQGLGKIVDSASGFNMERRLFGAGTLNGSNTLIGYPYELCQHLTAVSGTVANALVLGDFSQSYIGNWGTMTIRASDVAGNNLQKMQTSIIAAVEVDFAFVQPSAFCTVTGVTA